MKQHIATVEIHATVGKQQVWGKIYDQLADGTMRPGSRTLNNFTGRTLARKLKEYQQELDRVYHQ